MQYNLEEFNTIIHHIKEMNIPSQKGIVYSEPSTLILFDLYNVLEISHINNRFNVDLSDINSNHIIKYTTNDICIYKSKNKDINKLIDKRFNQIINLWEEYNV